jgi:hypothetical protein
MSWRQRLSPFAHAPLLIAIALALVFFAQWLYTSSSDGSFRRSLASPLVLQLALIVVGGALVEGLLKSLSAMRAKNEEDASKRLELLRRMRSAHVRVAHAQRLIKAEKAVETYTDQMRKLILVTRDLEEIGEDVKVTCELFTANDRDEICEGIRRIVPSSTLDIWNMSPGATVR